MVPTLADRGAAGWGRVTSTPVLLVTATVLFLDTVARWTVAPVLGTHVRFVGLAVVLAAIVLGRSAWLAVALGLFGAAAVSGDLLGGVVWAVAGGVSAAVGSKLWARPEQDGDDGRAHWYVRYGTVVVGTVVVLAATSAWLFDVVDRAAFSVTIVGIVPTNLVAPVIGAPLVRWTLARYEERQWHDRDRPLSRAARYGVLGTVVCWVSAGYVASYLFRAIEQASASAVANRLPRPAYLLLTSWGEQGEVAVFLVGVVALGVVAVIGRSSGPGGRGRLRELWQSFGRGTERS